MYYDGGRRKNVYPWIVILIIAVLILNAPPVKKFKLLKAGRILANSIIFPFKYATSAVYNGVTSGTVNFIRLKGIQKENELLNKQILEYQARLLLFSDLEKDNKKLRDMLSFKANYFGAKLMPAEIIARSGSSWFEVIEINRGSSDKIVPDSAVINEEGLVGRVLEVFRSSSRVLLITDPSSAVSVVDLETGEMGIITGNLFGPLSIKYMSANAQIKVGDKIITSGMSDIFPRGMLVGSVRSISKKDYDIFQKVDVNPAVHLSRLSRLYVVTKQAGLPAGR